MFRSVSWFGIVFHDVVWCCAQSFTAVDLHMLQTWACQWTDSCLQTPTGLPEAARAYLCCVADLLKY